MIGIYNAGGGSQPFKEFQLGEWKCLLPLTHMEVQRTGGGGGAGRQSKFSAGQWISLSLLLCPMAAIKNKLSFCREKVAEAEGLKLVSGQQLPWSFLAHASKVVAWPCT